MIVERAVDETKLAWALALAAKPHLDAAERDAVFVAIGAGETLAAIRGLLRLVALKRIRLRPDLVRPCVSWLHAYHRHEDERYLHHLIEDFVIPYATLRARSIARCAVRQPASPSSASPDRRRTAPRAAQPRGLEPTSAAAAVARDR